MDLDSGSIDYGITTSNQPWLTSDVVGQGSWIYELGTDEQKEVEDAFGYCHNLNKALHELTPDEFPLPKLGMRLRSIVASLERGLGFSLIRGLPIEKKTESDARLIAWGVGLHIGVALPQNAEGSLIHDVRDRGETSNTTLRGNGTSEEIQFHIDPCDVVALVCRRAAKAGGESRICSSLAIHNAIAVQRPDLLKVLREPFEFAAIDKNGAASIYSCPVFGWDENSFTSQFYRARIMRALTVPGSKGLSTKQHEAIELIHELASRPDFYLAMDLRPGDLQLLNNHVVYHARTAYEDYADPDLKRHLFRFWFSVPNSRRLSADFQEAWGQIERNTLRGGARGWNALHEHIAGYQARLADAHRIALG